jgi:hypothetical protein
MSPSRAGRIEPAASAPRTPHVPSLRYSPWYSSRGRGRSPASWFRARCAAGYTTLEWCVPGGSNSDPRGTGPLDYRLRRDAEGENPARSSERRRWAPAAGVGAEGGQRLRRMGGSRRSAGLSPGYGRRGSNSHGPGPPASEAGASTNSATSA